MIMVDVKGAVQQPGIYRLSTDSRVYQAIQAAGGFLSQADQKQINLAQKCKDEMVIYVPVKGETPVSDVGVQSTEEKKININTATASELEQLNSIGLQKRKRLLNTVKPMVPFSRLTN